MPFQVARLVIMTIDHYTQFACQTFGAQQINRQRTGVGLAGRGGEGASAPIAKSMGAGLRFVARQARRVIYYQLLTDFAQNLRATKCVRLLSFCCQSLRALLVGAGLRKAERDGNAMQTLRNIYRALDDGHEKDHFDSQPRPDFSPTRQIAPLVIYNGGSSCLSAACGFYVAGNKLLPTRAVTVNIVYQF